VVERRFVVQLFVCLLMFVKLFKPVLSLVKIQIKRKKKEPFFLKFLHGNVNVINNAKRQLTALTMSSSKS
jgi:hypothetical protein